MFICGELFVMYILHPRTCDPSIRAPISCSCFGSSMSDSDADVQEVLSKGSRNRKSPSWHNGGLGAAGRNAGECLNVW